MYSSLLLMFACSEKSASNEEPESLQQETVEEVSDCAVLGLEEIPFSSGPYGNNYGDVADDFTVSTLDGDWNFLENWSGCDSYIFVNYHSEYDYPVQIWRSSARDLIEASPRNVHYFFMSYEQGSEETTAQTTRDKFEDVLSVMSSEEQEYWRPRLHYVTTSAWEAGSVGSFLQNRGAWSVAIDPQQRFQEVGYLAMPPAFEGVFEALAYEAEHFNYLTDLQHRITALNATTVSVFDQEAVHNVTKDFQSLDTQALAAYDTLHIELQLQCGDPYYENCGEWDKLAYARLCAQADQENEYDTQSCQPHVSEVMGLCTLGEDITETACRSDEDCISVEEETTEESTEDGEEDTTEDGEGDTGEETTDETVLATCIGYEAAIDAETIECGCTQPGGESISTTQTCNEEGTGFSDCACPCDTEIGRWVTSYARGGHWLIDASPMLPFFQSGETQSVRYTGPYTYENTLTLHFSNHSKGGIPQTIYDLFEGGGFNEEYNSRYEPIEIEVPAEASRVELYAVISGHGWGSEVENCAEFCNHTHHFTINGTEYVFDHPEAGTAYGCVDQIPIGTTPNQFGTWPYGRGGWCAGKQVDPWIVDVTESVVPGETATITYRGLFNGSDYVPEPSNSGQGFGANIKMKSHLIVSW